jgi:tetratricopeptide (TPR) repeat protein
MKDADAWFEEGMKDVELSWHADYQSEVKGDLEDAISDFDKALGLRSDHADAWFQKGLALARLRRHEEAAGALAEAVRLRPDDAERWLHRAKALARLERHEAALAAFDETLRRRANDSEARYGKAETLEALSRDAEALAAWACVLGESDCRTVNACTREVRVVTTDFRRVRALVSRANALARLGRRADAISAYRDVMSDAWGMLHGPLAPPVFYDGLRHLEAARSAYYGLLQERSQDRAAWQAAGDAFLRAGRAQDALAAYERLMPLAPEDADVWRGKAEALVQAGRQEEAVAAYREALRIDPGYLAASARLKVVLEAIATPAVGTGRRGGKWKVMGCDTFSREEYLVGEFATEKEALARMRASEARAEKTQDDGLRDRYWIVPPA